MSASGTSPLATPMPSHKLPQGTWKSPVFTAGFADYLFEKKIGPGREPAFFCPRVKIIASGLAAEI
jgi:hypothetical protein